MNKTQKQILKEIEKYWKEYPDLRFGQVLCCLDINRRARVMIDTSPVTHIIKDNFNMPDEEMLKRIKESK